MRTVLSIGFGLALSVVGCSHDDGQAGPPDLGFTINGHAFSQQAEGAGQVYTNNDVSMPAGWIVELYNSQTAGCFQFMSNGQYGTVIQLHFPQKPIGTFDVTIGNTVFLVNGNANAANPSGGQLKVIEADGNHIAGFYDIIFKSGEHLAGTFNAHVCN